MNYKHLKNCIHIAKRKSQNTMTKKDYVLIANILNEVKPTPYIQEETEENAGKHEIYGNLIIKFAQALHQENDKFNKIKFFEACGVKVTK